MDSQTTTTSTLAWRAYTGQVALPTIFFAGITLALYALVIYLGITGKWSLGICCIINAVLTYLIFTPLHEASHGNISGKNRQLKGTEKIIGWLSGIPLTLPLPMFQYLHFTHHSHTNDPAKDPDYWVASRNPFFIIIKCFTILGDYYYFFFRDSKKQLADSKTKTGFYLGIIGLLTIYGLAAFWGFKMGWEYPVFLWLLPGLIAAAFLAFVFDWLPHHPHSIQEKYLDTRIILFPGLSILLVSQNMHLIHHLYCNIPFYKYGAAFKKMRKHLEDKGANIEEWLKAEDGHQERSEVSH